LLKGTGGLMFEWNKIALSEKVIASYK